MLTLEELKKHLKDQWKLLVNIHICNKNRLRFENNKYDFEEVIKKHGFFKHHFWQLHFVLGIELSKLYGLGKNDKRSFLKLCNVLENSKYDDALLKVIDDNRNNTANIIKSKEDILTISRQIRTSLDVDKDLIMKVLTLRDKVYAHTDPTPTPFNISSNEWTQLIKNAGSIYNTFNYKLFFNTTLFEEVRDWDIDYVFFHMSNSKIKDLEEQHKKYKL